MITYNIRLSSSNLLKIESAGTVIQLCSDLCLEIFSFLKSKILRVNERARDKMDTCIQMLLWYFGIIVRACGPSKYAYRETPEVIAIYLETKTVRPERPTKVAFNVALMSKVESPLLLEFAHTILTLGLKSIAPHATLMTESQFNHWTSQLISLTEDVASILRITPVIDGERKITFSTILIKFSLDEGPDLIHDLLE